MSDYSSAFSNQSVPQPQPESIECNERQFDIGIPKEYLHNETRIVVSKETLSDFSSLGYATAIETGAIQDKEREVGLKTLGNNIVLTDKKTVFSASIVLKVQPPTIEEAKLLRQGGVLFSEIHHNCISKELFHILQGKNITWFNIWDICEPMTENKPLKMLYQNAVATFIPYIIAHFTDLLPCTDRFPMGKNLAHHTPLVKIVGYGEAARNATHFLLGLGYNIHLIEETVSTLQVIDKEYGPLVEKSLFSPNTFFKDISKASIVLFDLADYHGKYFPMQRQKIYQSDVSSLWIDLARPFCPMIDDLQATATSEFRKLSENLWYHSCENILSIVPDLIAGQAGDILSRYFFQPFAKQRNMGILLLENPHLHSAIYLYNGKVCHRETAQRLDAGFHDLNFLRNSLLS